MENDTPSPREPLTDLGPEEGGGPPLALPWTLIVEGEQPWSADLEHPQPSGRHEAWRHQRPRIR